MTQAIIARRDGDTFQARMFWDRAARLLDEHGAIAKVGFEKGPKSFDDIWIEYREGAGPCDQNGTRLRRVHIQCKWHTTPNHLWICRADRPGVHQRECCLIPTEGEKGTIGICARRKGNSISASDQLAAGTEGPFAGNGEYAVHRHASRSVIRLKDRQ